MRKAILLLVLAAISCAVCAAQTPAPAAKSDDISGMYTFLREGEFVQINVEDGVKVTGFVSRYGDSDTDKDEFLDHMFTSAELKGNHLHFKTRTVHGVSYEFSGTVETAPGKTSAEEGYRVLRGKLTQLTEEDNKKASKSREVTLKSFPADISSDQPAKH